MGMESEGEGKLPRPSRNEEGRRRERGRRGRTPNRSQGRTRRSIMQIYYTKVEYKF
jgi:hypothetical protein